MPRERPRYNATRNSLVGFFPIFLYVMSTVLALLHGFLYAIQFYKQFSFSYPYTVKLCLFILGT